jgi:hypothetical protein
MHNDRNNDYGQNSPSQNESHNSWQDENRNTQGRNHDALGSEKQQAKGTGSRGSGMNDAPMNDDQPYSQGSYEARSDNDDFNDNGFDEDSREAQSRTFKEDEDTWENDQRMSSGPNSDSYGNSGTRNNNWDANDPIQRTTGIHDDEQQDSWGDKKNEE